MHPLTDDRLVLDVVKDGSKMWSIDNRRLFCLSKAPDKLGGRHDDDTCTDDDTPSRRMIMIRHMKMMHMRIHAQTMVHLHPRMTMTQAQTMIHPGRRMTMIHAQMQAQTMPLAPLVSMRRAHTRNVHPTEIADEPLADLRGRELSERESV